MVPGLIHKPKLQRPRFALWLCLLCITGILTGPVYNPAGAQNDAEPFYQDDGSIALQASEDTTISTISSNTPDGSRPQLAFGGLQGEQTRSLVKFDLSVIPSQSVAVARAYLILSPVSVWSPVSFQIIQQASPWNEASSSYGSVNITNDSPQVTYIFPPTQQPIAFDVTPLVQSWFTGTPNHGFALVTNDIARSNVTFHARESTEGQPPLLLIETDGTTQSALPFLAPAASEVGEIAYVSNLGEVWLTRTNGMEPMLLSDSGSFSSPQWSLTGDKLYYLRNVASADSAIMEYDFATASERVVFVPANDILYAFTILPKKNALIFSYEVPSPFGEPDPIYGRAWDMCLSELDIESGKSNQFFCGGQTFYTRITPTPDESSLVITEAYFEFARLVSLALNGSPLTANPLDSDYLAVDFYKGTTAIGYYAFYGMGGEFGLRLFDVGDWRLGATPIAIGASEPDFGPYGQRIAFVEHTNEGRFISIYQIADGRTARVVAGTQPAWRPSVMAQLSPLLEEKRDLFSNLTTSYYRLDIWPLEWPISAYDESSSEALVLQLADPAQRENLTRTDIERFQRLVLLEHTLAGTLRSYELVRDDNADALVDFYGIAFSTFAIFLGDPNSHLIQKTMTDIGNAWIVLGYDGEEREIRESAYQRTVDGFTLPLDGPAEQYLFLAEQLFNEGLRHDVAIEWTRSLTETVQPTLETGVNSVLQSEVPYWEMTGTYQLAEIQSSQVLSRTVGTAADARRLNEALFEGLAVNEVNKDIADMLSLKATSGYTLLASVATRFIQVALDRIIYVNGQEAMVCIRDFSARASDLIFMPDRDFVCNCEDLYPPDDDSAWPDWLHPLSWFGMRQNLTTSMGQYLDAVDHVTEAMAQADPRTIDIAEQQLTQQETALLSRVGNEIGLLAPTRPTARHTQASRELIGEMLLLEFGVLAFRGQLDTMLAGNMSEESMQQLTDARMTVLQAALNLSGTLSSLPEEISSTQLPANFLILETPFSVASSAADTLQFEAVVKNGGSNVIGDAVLTVADGDETLGSIEVSPLAANEVIRIPVEFVPPRTNARHVLVTLSYGDSVIRRLLLLQAGEASATPGNSTRSSDQNANNAASDQPGTETVGRDGSNPDGLSEEVEPGIRWARPAGITFILLGALGLLVPISRWLPGSRRQGNNND